MIKFFRNTRQKLLLQDNTRKYLLYAIGEIFLVVIGILIALQVNNWNEERKIQNEETLLLETIFEDLETDSNIIGLMKHDAIETENLLYQVYLESRDRSLISDSLQVHSLRKGKLFFSPTKDNHTDNLNSIHNVEIRKALLYYFRLAAISTESKDFNNNYLIEDFRPYLAKKGIQDVDALFNDRSSFQDRRVSFLKYDKLIEQYGSEEFDQHMFSLKLRNQYYKETVERFSDQNEVLKAMIIEEIKSRK